MDVGGRNRGEDDCMHRAAITNDVVAISHYFLNILN